LIDVLWEMFIEFTTSDNRSTNLELYVATCEGSSCRTTWVSVTSTALSIHLPVKYLARYEGAIDVVLFSEFAKSCLAIRWEILSATLTVFVYTS
jgi:hypothetical protein